MNRSRTPTPLKQTLAWKHMVSAKRHLILLPFQSFGHQYEFVDNIWWLVICQSLAVEMLLSPSFGVIRPATFCHNIFDNVDPPARELPYKSNHNAVCSSAQRRTWLVWGFKRLDLADEGDVAAYYAYVLVGWLVPGFRYILWGRTICFFGCDSDSSIFWDFHA